MQKEILENAAIEQQRARLRERPVGADIRLEHGDSRACLPAHHAMAGDQGSGGGRSDERTRIRNSAGCHTSYYHSIECLPRYLFEGGVLAAEHQPLIFKWCASRKYIIEDRLMGIYDSESNGFKVHDNLLGETKNTLNVGTFGNDFSLDCCPERQPFLQRIFAARLRLSDSAFSALVPHLLRLSTDNIFSLRSKNNLQRGAMCAGETQNVDELIEDEEREPSEKWLPRADKNGRATGEAVCDCEECTCALTGAATARRTTARPKATRVRRSSLPRAADSNAAACGTGASKREVSRKRSSGPAAAVGSKRSKKK
jgi:hypothetical protein